MNKNKDQFNLFDEEPKKPVFQHKKPESFGNFVPRIGDDSMRDSYLRASQEQELYAVKDENLLKMPDYHFDYSRLARQRDMSKEGLERSIADHRESRDIKAIKACGYCAVQNCVKRANPGKMYVRNKIDCSATSN